MNLKDKAMPLNETKVFIFGKKKVELDVYNIDIRELNFNKNNGRIFLNMSKYSDNSNISNEDIETFIWEKDKDSNRKTLESIRDFGQIEVGLVDSSGTIIDGNRRFTCLRKLFFEENHEGSMYFKAAIVSEESNLTKKDIKKYELNVQFGREVQVGYHNTDKYLSIYHLNNDPDSDNRLSIEEIAEQMNEDKSKIATIIAIVENFDVFLEFYNQKGKYEIIESKKLVEPISEITKYTKQINKDDSIPRTGIQSRINLLMSSIFLIKFQNLRTQGIRDDLIKAILKHKNPSLADEFVSTFDNTYFPEIEKIISNEIEDIDELIETLKSSDFYEPLNTYFSSFLQKANAENELQHQLNLSQKAFDFVAELDISYSSGDSSDIKKTYKIIKNNLENIKVLIETKLSELEENDI